MRTRWETRAYAALPLAFLVLAFLLPVGLLLLVALGAADPRGGIHLDALLHPRDIALLLGSTVADLASTPYYRNRIAFTILQAAGSTTLSLALGVPLARVFATRSWPGRRLLRAAFTVPFVLPTVVVALALQAYLGGDGWFGVDVLSALGPVGAILLAHVFYNTGLVLRLVGTHWERMDLRLVDAARTLGTPARGTFWRLELPLVRPAIVASALLVFVFDLTSFGVVLLLGGPRVGTIETLVYEELVGFRPHYATAATLALLQLAITYGALAVLARQQRRLATPAVPQVPRPRRRLDLQSTSILLLGALALFLPTVALVAGSFWSRDGWSTAGYRLLANGQAPLGAYTAAEAFANSGRFAFATLVVALPLAAMSALAFHRARHTRRLETLFLLPLGLSPIVLGLGLLLAWDGTFLPDLRSSPARIVLAHVLVAFPFAARILSPALDAIPAAMRDAARTLGLSGPAVAWRVDLPLAFPALLVAGVFAVATSLGEFGAALMLRRPETTTVPLAILDGFGRIGAPFHAEAQAMAVILLIASGTAFLLLERLRVPGWSDLG